MRAKYIYGNSMFTDNSHTGLSLEVMVNIIAICMT